MRAAVTGGAGFIGSMLVDRLLENGHEVIAVDNLSDRYSDKMHFLQPHVGKDGFRLDDVDILDLNGLRRSVEGADVVFHLATYSGGRLPGMDPTQAQKADTIGTFNVLLAAKNAGVRRFISSSSSAVYTNTGSHPVKETGSTAPTTPYAAGKLAAEEYCRLFFDQYGMQTVSLRHFTVYGPRQHPETAISRLTKHALDGQRPQIFGDGEQDVDLTFISDVVDAIGRCADCPNIDGRPINICSGRTTTVNRVAELILQAAGRPDLEPEYLPSLQDDMEHTWGDNTWAKEILGWEPKVPIEKGVVEFVEWYKKIRDQMQ